MNACRLLLRKPSSILPPSSSHHGCFYVTYQIRPQKASTATVSAFSTGLNNNNDDGDDNKIPQQQQQPPPNSERKKFKEIPVNQSILRYIQEVGVGKPKRRKRIRKQKSKLDGSLLGKSEEMELFGRIRRRPNNRTPPPPFALPSRFSGVAEESKIVRHPVKLTDRVGSTGKKFPKTPIGCPEVALAGRSNVGKSTLLNALLYSDYKYIGHDDDDESYTPGRRRSRRRPTRQTAPLPRGLKAKTSSKPGETREISFYRLSATLVDNDIDHKVTMFLVDLPGYGFAFASEERANDYVSMMQNYILERGNSLKRLLLLIDARHGMKKADVDFIEALQNKMYTEKGTSKKRELPPIQIVLTKCDLVPQVDIARRVTLVRQQLSDCLIRDPGILPTMMVSAQMEGQAGVLELQKELAALTPKPESKNKPTQQKSEEHQKTARKFRS